MVLSRRGNAFRITGPLRGKSTDDRWIPSQMGSDTGLDVFFDVSQNKQLNKQFGC